MKTITAKRFFDFKVNAEHRKRLAISPHTSEGRLLACTEAVRKSAAHDGYRIVGLPGYLRELKRGN